MQQTLSYNQLLEEKKQRLEHRFADLTVPALEVFSSPEQHYRMRAEFRVWHDGDDLYYIMFDKQTKQPYRVDTFATASRLINMFMPRLLDAIRDKKVLRHKLFQVDFLSTLSGEMLISLLYHKQLDDQWLAEAKQLKAELAAIAPVDLIGRARKQKICLDKEHVEEVLSVFDTPYRYRQVENSFTQPNAKVCEKMLEWACEVTEGSNHDLLELYCGNGNFSIPLSRNFNRVIATEIAKPSVESAQYNIAANGVENLQIIRLSSEEFTQAYQGERVFRRLDGIELQSYQFGTLFVDPPRAGLDDQTRAMAKAFPRILYISCNPETLHRDLTELSADYDVKRAALFDQFPYTDHAEMGVLLERKC